MLSFFLKYIQRMCVSSGYEIEGAIYIVEPRK